MVNMRQAAREEAHNRLQAQSPASLRRARRRQAYAAQRAARAEARPQEGAETNLEEIPVMAADNTRPDMPIPHDGTRIGAQIPTQVPDVAGNLGLQMPAIGDADPVGSQEPRQVFQELTNIVVGRRAIRRGRPRGCSRAATAAAASTEVDRVRAVRGGRSLGRGSVAGRRGGMWAKNAGPFDPDLHKSETQGDVRLPTGAVGDARRSQIPTAYVAGIRARTTAKNYCRGLRAPEGWRPPPIFPSVRSPILLRRHAASPGAVSGPEGRQCGISSSTIGLGGVDNVVLNSGDRDHYGGSNHRAEEESLRTDDEGAILDGAECVTPPQNRLPTKEVPVVLGGAGRVQLAIYKFTLQDFIPGAPEPNPYLRQSVGEYLPWLHNCGEETCPFTEPPMHRYQMSLETGLPLPNSELSPGDHIRVDKRAFTRDVFVKVKLVLLGYDPDLWGDLECFSGVVVDRYYQEVSGSPMFSVDFGGSIGHREVRVMDTVLDNKHGQGGSAQRALDFADVSSGSAAGARTHPDIGSSEGTALPGNLHPLDPSAPLLSDSDLDIDWMGEFEDFPNEEDDGGQKDTNEDDEVEDPMAELGIYNPEEDLGRWTFRQQFDDSQWQEQQLTLVGGPRRCTGPLPGSTNPGNARQSSNCQQYFSRFWADDVLSRIVEETNRYANQPSVKFPSKSNGRADWFPLTAEELLCWFGVLTLMGLKDVPHIRLYWSANDFYGCPLIQASMSRQRFEAITRCIHLVDNSILPEVGEEGHDKIGKVRWLVEHFSAAAKANYNCEVTCTVDEMMLPYKGRYCNIRQYLKGKPVKFGIKIWALASSQSRYVSNVIVYLGAGDVREEDELVGADAVLVAVRGMEGHGHVIILDNFFTSVRLFMTLLGRGFYATGTVKKVSKGFPPSLAGFPATHQLPRGTLVVKMHRSRKIVAIVWIDSRLVWLLSTALDPVDLACTAPRWVRRERLEFPTSPILLQYQKNMRGIDVVDQYRGYYTTALQSHKWWHRILTFILDSTLFNSYVLYSADAETLGLPRHTRQLWHFNLARSLVAPFVRPNIPRGRFRTLGRRGFHHQE